MSVHAGTLATCHFPTVGEGLERGEEGGGGTRRKTCNIVRREGKQPKEEERKEKKKHDKKKCGRKTEQNVWRQRAQTLLLIMGMST